MRRTHAALAATVIGFTGLLATTPAYAATSLTVASWNVCKGGADGTSAACAAPAPGWSVRRDRVVNVIKAAHPEVLGLQEATMNATATAKTQQDDIKALLAPLGYTQPTFDPNGSANDCKRPRDAAGQLAGPNPCDNTTMLMYDTATVKQAGAAGVTMASNIVGGLDADSAIRPIAWAFLSKDGQTFLALSGHTSTIKDPAHEASRVALANALTGWTQGLMAANNFPATTPVVLMADLNSFDKRQPQGAQTVLRNGGWTDAYMSPSKRNIQYSTINYSAEAKGDPQGFPVRPAATKPTKKNPKAAATRIDYVMGRGVTFSNYEVVMFLQGNGNFQPEFQASDHQMVKATVSF